MAKRKMSGIRVADRGVGADDLKLRLAERDQRQANDRRSDAERWLGDPPPGRAANRRAGMYRQRARELAERAKEIPGEDDRRHMLRARRHLRADRRHPGASAGGQRDRNRVPAA
jgi:hypothetical protein